MEQRLRERIEAAVSESLKGQDGLVGCFQDEDVRYKLRLLGEQPLRVVMVGHEKILGLPPELVV